MDVFVPKSKVKRAKNGRVIIISYTTKSIKIMRFVVIRRRRRQTSEENI